MRYPKDVLTLGHVPEARLAEVIVRLKNNVGALGECANSLAKYNVNLLSGFHTVAGTSKYGVWCFFADFTNAELMPEDMADVLRQLPSVESVETCVGRDGVVIDDRTFPIRNGSKRVTILTSDSLNEMIERIWEVFGQGAAVILDQMGESMGKYSAQDLLSEFGPEYVRNNFQDLLKTYTASGLAIIHVKHIDKEQGRMVLEMEELFECQRSSKSGSGRPSALFRAHLKGFVSTVFGSAFEVSEIECVAMGGQKCVFSISALEAASPRLAQQDTAKDKTNF